MKTTRVIALALVFAPLCSIAKDQKSAEAAENAAFDARRAKWEKQAYAEYPELKDYNSPLRKEAVRLSVEYNKAGDPIVFQDAAPMLLARKAAANVEAARKRAAQDAASRNEIERQKSVAGQVEGERKPATAPTLDLTNPPPAQIPQGEVFYFAIQRLSVTTGEGVYSIPPGTQLRLVRTAGPILIVSDGKNEFEAQQSQLTNDLELAIRSARLDEAAQRQAAADRAAKASQPRQQVPVQQAPTQQTPQDTTEQIEQAQKTIELLKSMQDLFNSQGQQYPRRQRR